MNNPMIKNGKVIDNEWRHLAEDHTSELPSGKLIIPLTLWETYSEQVNAAPENFGLKLNSDQAISDFKGELSSLPLIAIDFPVFADGRGFSLGSLLRERYEYKNELRACGNFMRDQLSYLSRCGFDAFELSYDDLPAAVDSLKVFSEHYQNAADTSQAIFLNRVSA